MDGMALYALATGQFTTQMVIEVAIFLLMGGGQYNFVIVYTMAIATKYVVSCRRQLQMKKKCMW